MPRKSTGKRDDNPADFDSEDLVESMILGVTSEGECVYIHTFDDDIRALEFLETLTVGFRSDILIGLSRRSMN